jgi:acetyltransferase EpsM
LNVGERDAGVIVYGGGGHGRTLIDLLRTSAAWWPAAVIDDGDIGSEALGVSVLGGFDVLAGARADGLRHAVNGIGPIGSTEARSLVFDRLTEAGFDLPPLAHERSIVEPSAMLAPGSQVLAGAYIGTEAHVGYGAIVNSLAVVSHDCRLGALSHIGPSSSLAGEGVIGDRSLLGVGVTMHIGVVVGEDVRIGNGATIKADVPAGTRVRAGSVWPA